MAKELDKLRKEFAPLRTQVSTVVTTHDSMSKKFTHLLGLQREAAKEVTRMVGALRQKGHPGTKLADFEKEKDFVPVMAQAAKADASRAETVKEINANKAVALQACTKLEKLRKHLAEEIAGRKTKKKFLGVDSASLPELEKLLKEVLDAYSEAQDVGKENVSRSWSPDGLRRQLEEAVDDSPDDVKSDDLSAQDTQMLDSRVAHRNANQANTQRQAVKQHLTEALQFRKVPDDTMMHDALEKATTAREAVQTLAEAYERIIKDMNPTRLKGMQADSNGKKVLASIALIRKLDAEAGRDLQAVVKLIGS